MYPFAPGPIGYVGSFKEKSWNGRGTLRFTNGITFMGTFDSTRIRGDGTLSFKDGKKVEGDWEWVDIVNHYKGGYNGEMVSGKPHGQGTLISFTPLGQIFKGQFKNGLRHGEITTYDE